MRKVAIVALVCLPFLMFAGLVLGGGAVVIFQAASCMQSDGQQQGHGQPSPSVAQPSNDQKTNAQAILAEVKKEGLPQQAGLDALDTALTESNLKNSPIAQDHDSVGLFQQRPSQGWGTVQQIMDPAYATSKFLEHLKAIPNWQSLVPQDAAYRVQQSAAWAAPRYAQVVGQAQQLVGQLWGGGQAPAGGEQGQACRQLQSGSQPAASGALTGNLGFPVVNPIPAPGWKEQIPVPQWPAGLPGTRVNPPQISPQCVAGALWSWATEHLSDPQFASPPPINGNAADMFPDAQRKGFQLADQPAPGEIVVWKAGSFYGPYGHVGTVTAVQGDRYEVTEQNLLNDTSDVSAHWGTWDVRSVAWPDSNVEGFVKAPPAART